MRFKNTIVVGNVLAARLRAFQGSARFLEIDAPEVALVAGCPACGSPRETRSRRVQNLTTGELFQVGPTCALILTGALQMSDEEGQAPSTLVTKPSADEADGQVC